MQANTLGKVRRPCSHKMRAQAELATSDLPVVELLLRHRLYRTRVQVVEQAEECVGAVHLVRKIVEPLI